MILRKYLKPRFLVMFLGGAYCLVFGDIDYGTLPAGLALMAAGILIRLWADGYIIKNESLTTSGPYAFVRHPLYLGTLLVFAGFMVMLREWGAMAVLLPVVAFVYRRTIEREEEHLARTFGKDFFIYCYYVPGLIPSFVPYRKGRKWGFDWRRIVFNHNEHVLLIWMAILVLAFCLKKELIVSEGGGFRAYTLSAAVLALIILETTVRVAVRRLKDRLAYCLN